jgi:N-dimethylarginine dimethylaminohydrolase
MTLKERVERAGERVSLKSNAVLSNKKRIFERARKRRFRKKLKKAGGKVENYQVLSCVRGNVLKH